MTFVMSLFSVASVAINAAVYAASVASGIPILQILLGLLFIKVITWGLGVATRGTDNGGE